MADATEGLGASCRQLADADVVLLHRTFPVRPPPAVQMLILEDNRHQITLLDQAHGDPARPGIEEEGPEGVITRRVHFTSEGIGNVGGT